MVVDKANPNYSAYSPDLPGYVATGKTQEEATSSWPCIRLSVGPIVRPSHQLSGCDLNIY
ncbi:MAG: hypothetical protein C4311_10510 [Chloroflexota bacterium]